MFPAEAMQFVKIHGNSVQCLSRLAFPLQLDFAGYYADMYRGKSILLFQIHPSFAGLLSSQAAYAAAGCGLFPTVLYSSLSSNSS